MSGPWEDFAATENGPWADFASPQQAAKSAYIKSRVRRAASGNQFAPGTEPEPVGAIPQVAGSIARMGAQALAAIPLAALDAGYGLRNFGAQALGAEQVETPSQKWNRALNSLIPAPQGLLGNVTEIAGSALIGSRLPVPEVKGAPPIQPKIPAPKQAVLAASQDAGYVVPPATVKPSAINKALEGVAGKLSTAQLASAKNQATTDRLVKSALGLSDDTPLTIEAIQSVRRGAGDAYKVIRSVGRIEADPKFQADLAAIGSKFRGAAKDFPELAKSEVDDLISGLNKPGFDADSAVDMISILRGRADKAFASGDKELGSAIKAGSKALEDAIERNLVAQGAKGAKILNDFREARQLIAKTYSIEKAFNQSTGSIDATKLAAQLARGKPLSGEVKRVAQFAQAFPKAARAFNESLPGISPLDYASAGGVSAMTREPWYLLYPFARQGVRNALLSRSGQNALAAQSGPWNPAARMGAVNAMTLLEQRLAD